MTRDRIVLDTNVLVSALLFPSGTLTWLRGGWQSQQFRPLASRDTTAELLRVLNYPKFRLAPSEKEDLLADYLPWCEVISVPRNVKTPACRDPFDLPFLRLAVAGKADALVTGDHDLLSITANSDFRILTPAEYRRQLDSKV